jgi:hypothetical protein
MPTKEGIACGDFVYDCEVLNSEKRWRNLRAGVSIKV